MTTFDIRPGADADAERRACCRAAVLARSGCAAGAATPRGRSAEQTAASAAAVGRAA